MDLANGRCRSRSWDSDGFARNDEFHAAIALAPARVVIGPYGGGVAEAAGVHRIGRHTLMHEVIAYRIGAVFRERLVAVVVAHVVGVTADLSGESWVGHQDSSD